MNRPPEVINARGVRIASDSHASPSPHDLFPYVPSLQAPFDYRRADVWSIGCLVYELVKQPHPWVRGEEGVDVLSCKKHTADEVAALKPPPLPAAYVGMCVVANGAMPVSLTLPSVSNWLQVPAVAASH